MNYISEGGNIIVSIEPSLFDLTQTLSCGQCFRWTRSNGIMEWYCLWKRAFCPANKHILFSRGLQKRTFFPSGQIILTWTRITDAFTGSSVNATQRFGWLPLPPVGCEFSVKSHGKRSVPFILSQNNNIPRIKKLLKRFVPVFGERLPGGGFFLSLGRGYFRIKRRRPFPH